MDKEILDTLNKIKKEQVPFSLQQTKLNRTSIDQYLRFYHFQLKNISVRHNYGYLKVRQEQIFVQSFLPDNPKGTVFLLHGYLDHLGSLSSFIMFLLKKNYQVIGFDMPGHGLSSGEKVSIQDFHDYVTVLDTIIEKVQKEISTPLFLVAHSTGAAVSFSFLSEKNHLFKKIVLVAPLIRSASFHISHILYNVTRPFIRSIPRVYRSNSSEKAFIHFIKKDPLQSKQLSMNWFGAKLKWFNQLKKGAVICKERVLIFQGNKDKTVDWRYNLHFLKKALPENQIYLIKGGKHHLLNEQMNIRQKVFEQIYQYFSN
ncbi:alpha/beta hydrolase [Alkalihalobacillus trypoxylicola]|uniref:Serine aminopeptidase S33 domain-containing protein n=1 Tax=Alkalihalobacillus trypoxylicola TaxID=519424 RepID=A0A161PF01_9BACI|nr:alpha/beta fold hydrolase [Alkalihalobacillus trypoxylicola]KYG26960.1 hypothetical protein AZF04_11500 [Alkalihalobacillus trypoxylicola]